MLVVDRLAGRVTEENYKKRRQQYEAFKQHWQDVWHPRPAEDHAGVCKATTSLLEWMIDNREFVDAALEEVGVALVRKT